MFLYEQLLQNTDLGGKGMWPKIKNLNDLKNVVVDVLLPTAIIFWYFFLSLQLAFGLGEKNHEIFFNYVQISLT